MLVCHISMRPPRRAIAADITEAANAEDASTLGNVIFATIVDDPATGARDTVDAYSGEIMQEAASATDAADATGTLAGALDEGAEALDTSDAIMAIGVSIDETTTAADDVDASTSSTYAGTVDESATAADDPDATITPVARSAMVIDAFGPVFINPGTSREADAAGVMVNI